MDMQLTNQIRKLYEKWTNEYYVPCQREDSEAIAFLISFCYNIMVELDIQENKISELENELSELRNKG